MRTRAVIGCCLASLATSCGIWVSSEKDLNYEPSRVPMGPLAIGVWLPAGLDEFRFEPFDQEQLLDLGVNYIEWLQPAVQGERTAEQIAMEFCDRQGLRMPVLYPPIGYPPTDKLQDWATRTELGPAFPDSVRERVRALLVQWQGAPGFHGYLIGHEDYESAFYDALEKTVQVLSEEDPLRPALTVGRVHSYENLSSFADAFFAEGGQPNVLQHEHYVFTGDLPGSGSRLQRRLSELVDGYETVARTLQGRYGRWHAIVQVHAERREGDSSSLQMYRHPNETEIRLQAGLALSRGASGIVYFLYSSGIEDLLDADGQLRERRTYEGLVDRQGIPSANYTSVLELNEDLKRFGEIVQGLHFHGGFSSRGFRRNSLVASSDSDLEFGLYGDGVEARLVMIVNRRPMERRTVDVGFHAVEVVDADTGERLPLIDARCDLQLEPGGWRILEICQESERP